MKQKEKQGMEMNLPAGVELVHELTVIAGRPPAKLEVMRIRSVRAPIWDELAVQTILLPLLTETNWAMGHCDAEEEPMV